MYYSVTAITATEFIHELNIKRKTDWIKIGQALGISYSSLVKMYDNGLTVEEYGQHVFKEWSTLEKPTWTKIVSSLHACNMEQAGNELSSKHGKLSVLCVKCHNIFIVIYDFLNHRVSRLCK